jgi:hypothetical protein
MSSASGLEDLHDAVNLVADLHDIIRAANVDNVTAHLKEE